ncbi:hypothetical protein RclHR1_00280025 [Rhizophagus clarus]|uniref:Carbohydrate-binding module family 13 protein n=1 Tax=Rhizophagus clarus TaxID=94130 RepID=A0A2Z6R2T6_9GLOM|nr:hypothetical protein RclHR1_00280025 [Rhizophagus clarus]GES83746.1 carbohydrate-binding module family 13 protein [Rhizophagus clarus]
MVRRARVRNSFIEKLSENLLEVLDDEEYHDVTIEVGEDPYVKVFRAHIVILKYRSPNLRKILSTNKKKSDGTLTHIKLPNISPEIFQIILRYIYGGIIYWKDYETSDIVKILVAANELELGELIPSIQSFLIKNKREWIEQNFNMIYRTSFEADSFSELQNFCTELMFKQPEKIFNSSDFTSIPENSLISLIQHDNLQMSDVQIWDHVLKWGIAQNPELSSDPSNYSNDDYNVLKNTLQHCIPFIKLYNLSSKEFLDNILPYRKILPEELYIDLLKFFLDHDYRPSTNNKIKETEIRSNKSIDSKIITIQHAELISKWIDGFEDTFALDNLHEYKLIFRGSRDGFMPENFHEICDDKPRTIAIIKVKDSDEILGGYNPINWESRECSPVTHNEFSETKDSFIFSFSNKNDIKNHELSRIKDEKHAIDNYFSYGPSFGLGDLVIYGGPKRSLDNCYSRCKRLSYEKQIREAIDYFAVEDYEVFQIAYNSITIG